MRWTHYNAFDRPSICKALAQQFPRRNAKTSRSPDKLEIAGASPLEVGHALIAHRFQLGTHRFHLRADKFAWPPKTSARFCSVVENTAWPPVEKNKTNISALLQHG